jgi:lysophospholipase L1-like esterase
MKLPLRKKVLFTAILLVALLGGVEGSLRAVWTPPPKALGTSLGEAGLVLPDEQLGWRTTPNVRVAHRFPLGVEAVTIETNSEGFRDLDHAPDPTPGVPRVVVLGDSFVFGYGVNNGEILTDYLRELVPEAEIINLGVSAYNLAQMHRLLRTVGLKYKPDVVVLALCQNDIARPIVPTVSSQQRAEQGWKSYLCDFSHLCSLARARAQGSKRLTRALAAAGLTRPLGGFSDLSDNVRPSLIDYPPELEDIWQAAVDEIAAINTTVEGAGARMLLSPIPAREAIDPDALGVTLSAVRYDRTHFDLAKPYIEIGAFCAREGIEYVDTYSAFRRAGGELYLPRGEIHFSAGGHRLFAETLAPRLRSMLSTGVPTAAPFGLRMDGYPNQHALGFFLANADTSGRRLP